MDVTRVFGLTFGLMMASTICCARDEGVYMSARWMDALILM